jgi:hypothetical protein
MSTFFCNFSWGRGSLSNLLIATFWAAEASGDTWKHLRWISGAQLACYQNSELVSFACDHILQCEREKCKICNAAGSIKIELH